MKVLIFNKNLTPKNIGGPCGYMYNIEEFLKESPSDTISFYPSGFVSYFIQKLKRKIERIVLKRDSFIARVYLSYFYTIPFAKEEISFINTFDYVHIHSVSYYLKYFYKNKRIHAKTVLTTHSPEPFVDELFNEYGYGNWLKKHPAVRSFLINREVCAYRDCYKIMFPVKEAREPYEKASPQFKLAFEELDSKFFYVPTAVNDVKKIEINNHIIEKYNLPEQSLKVCYIGRHTNVKGYDSLQSMAKAVWNSMSNVYFIVGGKESPLSGLDDNRWIELGWVNTPALLNEVDVFVLPNRDTYFDLILLEVLRQGTPVILSRTGGNKWFEDKGLKGMMFYDYNDSAEFSRHLQTVSDLKSTGQLDVVKKETERFFTSEFNMKNYMQRYVSQLESFKQTTKDTPPLRNYRRRLITVIVPVYNAEQYLDECVESIIRQKYNNLEIILVDDGSTDNSPKMCDKWAAMDERVKVVHKPNGGLSDARNAGLEIATGEFVGFVDSDDIIASDMYCDMLQIRDTYKAGMISCESRTLLGDEENVIEHYHKEEPIVIMVPTDYLSGLLDYSNDCSVCNKLFSRELIGNYRFEKGVYNEDILFMFDIMKNCNLVIHINQGYYKYRVTEGSITRTFNDRSLHQMYNAYRVEKSTSYDYKSIRHKAKSYAVSISKNMIVKIKENNCTGENFVKANSVAKKYIKKNILHVLLTRDFNYRNKIRVIKSLFIS